MANTVNDVMNVIASPDWGIRNIAGTNQEILAILGGVHNSKNNIHAIVDDIRTLLQKLVDKSTEKKQIEIGNKSPKVNPKHIQEILDETKDIGKSLNNLAKAIEKQSGKPTMPAVAKLTDKASQKVADAMIKGMEKQKEGGGMSALVDAFTKLRDISLKDLIFGNQKLKLISKVFKNAKEDLKIKEKDLNAILKVVNAAPEIVKALMKVSWRINKIIKNDVIQKLSDMLVGKNSLLTMSKALQKNEKSFKNASEASKNIKELASSLGKALRRIVFAALWSKLADIGIKFISITINNLTSLSKNLTKNKKEFDAGAKAAKNITVFIGNLLITSIFLTASIITVLPAILGALLLRVMVNVVLPLAKQLSRNNKHMAKATGSALIFTAFTGLMLISSIFLAKVAEHALEAMLGAVVVLGVVALNLITFKILQKATKEVLIGSLVMILMSVSLLLFGIALGKITAATKGVTLKQVGIIVAMTVLLAGAVIALGIPQVAALAALGSVVMLIMSVSLLVFGMALGKISKATENMKFKQVLLVSGSILALGLPIAGMGALAPAIAIGSIVLIGMSIALIPFLLVISQIHRATEKLKFKQIGLVAGAMGTLGLAVAGMGILSPAIALGSIALVSMSIALMPFLLVISQLHKATENIKFKQIGIVAGAMGTLGLAVSGMGIFAPAIALGSIALGAMSVALIPFILVISQLHKATEKLKFKQIGLVAGAMGTLGLAISGLALLSIPIGLGSVTLGVMGTSLLLFVKSLKIINDMGEIPAKKVQTVIQVMKSIGNFFKKNALKPRVVRSAKQYKKILRPFGDAVKHLVNLNKIKGNIPLDLVFQTLDAMKTIGGFYILNPIDKSIIKAARKYKRMLKPFGTTIKRLDKLRKMGSIPMDLVFKTLDAMKVIANYYKENPIEKATIKQSRKYKRMMKPFSKVLKHLSKLKEMGSIPMDLVFQTLDTMKIIADYYKNNPIERATIKQSRKYKRMMKPFSKVLKHLSKLKEMGDVPMALVYKTLDAMKVIANYYKKNPIERKAIKQSRKYKRMMKPFGKVLTYLSKLKKMKNVPIKQVYKTLDVMKIVRNFFTKNEIKRSAIKNARKFKRLLKPFIKTIKHINKLKDLQEVPLNAIKSIVSAMRYISRFYSRTTIIGKIDEKSKFIETVVDSFTTMSKNIQDKFDGMKEIDVKVVKSITTACLAIIKYYRFTRFPVKLQKIAKMNAATKLFADNAKYVKKGISGFSKRDIFKSQYAVTSMKKILTFLKTGTLRSIDRKRAEKNIKLLKDMSSALSRISNINKSNLSDVGDALSVALGGVNSVDMDQVKVVTDMFKAFNDINKSENILNKFAETVKEFTETCKELMEAMENNTDAIVGIETTPKNEENSSISLFDNIKSKMNGLIGLEPKEEINQPKGVFIANVDELAKSIANRINGALSIDIPDTQVQLTINGSDGNEWIISRY